MSHHLNRLRTILAILIAFALTLAPITSAWAATQMHAGTQAAMSAADAGEAEISDCMRAMQAQSQTQGQAPDQNCPCCDTPLKSSCPDMGTCLAKCSVHVIGILAPEAGNPLPTHRHDRPADPQEPPDWGFAPPAPPPRA